MMNLDRSHQKEKIDELLVWIKNKGLKDLGDNKHSSCQEFFHIVFYQAIEDNLRIVYDQIMTKLNEIYLRD